MILIKLIVGTLGCNCYIVGSKTTNQVVIIDPGAEADIIIKKIAELNVEPESIILTHGHIDHIGAIKPIQEKFQIPLSYNIQDYSEQYERSDKRFFIKLKPDKNMKEGDNIMIGDISLHILETGGHSKGGISLYTRDINEYESKIYDGIIFTGDLIFRRSFGRVDGPGGDKNLIRLNVRDKIMNNPEITDNFLMLPGHMGNSTIGEERKFWNRWLEKEFRKIEAKGLSNFSIEVLNEKKIQAEMFGSKTILEKIENYFKEHSI